MNWYARSAREEEMIAGIRGSLGSFVVFCKDMSGTVLRGYQKAPALAILRSIQEERGDTIVVLFPRQSGKNELQAQIETYLLTRFCLETCEMVKVSPTWKPQSLNAMRRLERVLSRNMLIRYLWRKEAGYAYAVGQARLYFMSGAPEAHIVGATANTLLEVDEAQDVLPTKFDKDILPMAASTNATRVFWGTAWTSQTLLARELSAAREAEKRDGVQRVFVIDAGRVAQEVPAYGKFVAEQVSRLGRFHPLIKTQFYSETIDAETGLFPASRLALMRGDHPAQEAPHPASQYALLLDVGGADENPEGSPGRRDSTALTVVAVEPAAPNLASLQAPTYRVVARAEWVGVDHNLLLKELRDLAAHWRATYLVVDATGVGAGLASFLEKALPGRVIPFVFSARSKSDLGWGFLAVIETGRYREYAQGCAAQMALQARFWEQAQLCASSVVEGPGKMLRWGVPDGTRSPLSGDVVHDDLLMSAALCFVLDNLDWAVSFAPLIVRGSDPLPELDRGF